jgi:hypothetical protein
VCQCLARRRYLTGFSTFLEISRTCRYRRRVQLFEPFRGNHHISSDISQTRGRYDSCTTRLVVSQQCGLRSKHFARRRDLPARRGLTRPTCCCCALDGNAWNARRVGFSAQTLPEVKALRKDSKMTLDNRKPCRPTDYDWEIGVNIWRIFT